MYRAIYQQFLPASSAASQHVVALAAVAGIPRGRAMIGSAFGIAGPADDADGDAHSTAEKPSRHLRLYYCSRLHLYRGGLAVSA